MTLDNTVGIHNVYSVTVSFKPMLAQIVRHIVLSA